SKKKDPQPRSFEMEARDIHGSGDPRRCSVLLPVAVTGPCQTTKTAAENERRGADRSRPKTQCRPPHQPLSQSRRPPQAPKPATFPPKSSGYGLQQSDLLTSRGGRQLTAATTRQLRLRREMGISIGPLSTAPVHRW